MERAFDGMLDVIRSILSEFDVDVVLERVTTAARELTGARYAALGVLGESAATTELVRFITAGIDEATRARIGALPVGRGVLGELIRNAVPLRLADVGKHPRSYGFPRGHPPMRTFLGVPILLDGKPFGNLYLAEKQDGAQFTEADEQTVVMLAELAAVALKNAQRYTEVRERREELERTVSTLEVTTQITRAVSGQTDLEKVLELVAKRGRALVKARILLIELLREDELIVAAGAGELSQELIGQRIAVRGTVAAQALRTGRVQRLEDELNRARFDEHGVGTLGVSADGGLVMPLVFRGQTYGVLFALDRLENGPAFTTEDERLLEAFATSAAGAVSTAQAVASNLERLAAVVESSSDAILTTDENGLITSWNNGAERLYGYSAQEMVGQPGDRLLPEEKADELAILPSLLRGEKVNRFESIRVCHDGSRIEVSLSVSAIHDSHGDVIGAASITRDITERKTMERMLAQTQRLESLGQLAGGIAHDMNNLLGVILSYADFALERLDGQAPAEEVGEIHTAAERAAALVRQLLLFAKQGSVASQRLDMNAIVGELQRMLSRTIGEHILLRTELEDTQVLVDADRAQVEQVVMNLALNARDAMLDGGALTISTIDMDIDELALRDHPGLAKPGRYVCLVVADTGVGMTPEVISKAFEPFYTTKPTGSGTGLGLATVYGILSKAGGYVEIDSAPEEGTTVKTYWPASRDLRDSKGTTTPVERLASPRASGGRILLVEDEEALRSVAVRILEAEGYTVLSTGLPNEAIEIASHHPERIDLLVTDVVMPEASGMTLATRVQSLRPDTQVLYISGYVPNQGVLPRDAAFLGKPFTRTELLTAVTGILESPRAQLADEHA